MDYEVVITDRAWDTFDAIRSQIQNRWGNKIASDFETRVLKTLDIISQSPFIFQKIKLDSHKKSSGS